MRALCGAIITAGALVGLGLIGLGYGIRFQDYPATVFVPDTDYLYGTRPMMLVLVTLLIMALVGMGIAFLGLLFHHQRRFHEHLNSQHAPPTPAPGNSPITY